MPHLGPEGPGLLWGQQAICLFHKYTTSRKGRGNPCGCPRLGRHEACPYWRRTCEMDIWGPTALVHEQFEVVLRLPLAEPFLYRWRLLEPLPLVGGDAIDILWGSDDVRCQEDEQVGLAL